MFSGTFAFNIRLPDYYHLSSVKFLTGPREIPTATKVKRVESRSNKSGARLQSLFSIFAATFPSDAMASVYRTQIPYLLRLGCDLYYLADDRVGRHLSALRKSMTPKRFHDASPGSDPFRPIHVSRRSSKNPAVRRN